MQNDVEVRFNVQAEYKQAMAAILALGKQLKALQEQSKLVLAAGGKGAAGGAGAGGGTMSPELARALEAQKVALASVSAEMVKTQQALRDLIATNSAGAEQLNALVASVAQLQKPAGDDSALREMAEQLKAAESEILRMQSAISKLEQQKERAAQREAQRNTQAEAVHNAAMKRQDDLAAKMKFDLMTRQQLAAEIQRLTKLREEAAAQNDSDTWDEYNEQLRVAHQSMETVNRELTVSKIGLQQQAQTGLMVADTMGQMAAAFESGNINIGQMTMQILSLATAIKAGMGPIGWVLLVVQGLQTAWQQLVTAPEAARKKHAEALNDMVEKTEALEAATINAAEAAKASHGSEVDRLKERLSLNDDILKKMQEAESFRAQMAELEAREKGAKDRARKAVAAGRLARGEITREEYEAELNIIADEQAAAKRADEVRRLDDEVRRQRLIYKAAEAAYAPTGEAVGAFNTGFAPYLQGGELVGKEAFYQQTKAYGYYLQGLKKQAEGAAADTTWKRDRYTRIGAELKVKNAKEILAIARRAGLNEYDVNANGDFYRVGDENKTPVNIVTVMDAVYAAIQAKQTDVTQAEATAREQRTAASRGVAQAEARRAKVLAAHAAEIKALEVERNQQKVTAEQQARAAQAAQAAARRQHEMESFMRDVSRLSPEEIQQRMQAARGALGLSLGSVPGSDEIYARDAVNLVEGAERAHYERMLAVGEAALRGHTARGLVAGYSGTTRGFDALPGFIAGGQMDYLDMEGLGRLANVVKATKETDDDKLLTELLSLLLKTEGEEGKHRRQLERLKRQISKRRQ